jgi:alpha-beta hydrolase superfamily lysophospholipase
MDQEHLAMRHAVWRLIALFLTLMPALGIPPWVSAAGQPAAELKKEPAWMKSPYPLSIPLAPGAPAPVYEQRKVLARDGKTLTVHHWGPPRAPADRPVVIFLHGIGMHGEAYGAIAAGFTRHGLTLVVPDLRGHGQSEGQRGVLADAQVLRSDLGEVIGLVNRLHPTAPVILAGESMGGLLAADYAAHGERRLAGVALLAPAFQLNRAQFDLADLFKWGLGGVPLDDAAKLAASTCDKGFGKARQADKWALHKAPAGYLLAIGIMQGQWPKAAARLQLPLFIAVAGQDKIVDRAAIKAVYEQARCRQEDKVWWQGDKAFHTLCWDPSTPEVIEALATWAVKGAK